MTVLPSPIPHPLDYSPWDLPGWIYEALDWVIGVEWPEGDERAVWDLADQWYAVAGVLAGPQTDANIAATEVRQGYGAVGAVAAAFDIAWQRVADGEEAPLPVLLAVSQDLGRVVEECGCDIEGAKLEVWIELGILVIELLALAVAAVLTAGAASPAAAGAIAATRFLVQQIFRRLLAQLARKTLKQGLKEAGERAAKQVTKGGAKGLTRRAAREGLEEAAEEAGVNLATQAYQNSTGRRQGVDVTDLGTNAIGGLAGGAAAPLAGLGRHATGRAARMAEHVGREMTGEVIADQAASLATGQGLTSLEDAVRAAASGARGSATAQTDHALQARLNGQLSALSDPSLPPLILPGPASPELLLDSAAPAYAAGQGSTGEVSIPTQRSPVEPLSAGPSAASPLPAGPSPAQEGSVVPVPSAESPQAAQATQPAGHDPGRTPDRQTEAGQRPEPDQPIRDVPTIEVPRPGEATSAPSAVSQSTTVPTGGPVNPPGPTLSTVAPPSLTPGPGVVTAVDMTGTGTMGGTATGTGGPSIVGGPAAAQPTVYPPPARPTEGIPSVVSSPRPEPPPAPPRSALVEALAPTSHAVHRPESAPAPTSPFRPPDRHDGNWTAERESLERRRYQGHYESQRARYEDTRRSRDAARLRGNAAEHYRRAAEYAAYARQLHRSGQRQLSDDWQRAANEETRAYGECLDLADEVLAGSVVPEMVAVDRPEDFRRINDDVGDLAAGAIETSDRSALSGDDHPPPIDRSRRYGQPGGLRPPLALHQLDVERQMPRDRAGNVLRTADPRVGDWFGLVNDGGPQADPTRGINCLDCTLSLFDTWVHGRPRVSAPRTFDAYQSGDVTRPLNGEQDGTARVEDVTGGRFQRLCDGTATTDAGRQQALDAGYRNLHDQLLLGGHGSFAFVVNHLERGGSHIWVALNQNGTVLYVDPQIGLVSDRPLYRHHGAAYPFNALDADVLVLDGTARPMPLTGLQRGLYSRRPDLPGYPSAKEHHGYGEPYLNRVHLLGGPE
ncbi:toxin glutamine deamidase domain-containing protein [Micromonospora sp. FIMYZ51]|uniref:toxin glutamine deamidase domain-containing protein n=1 Tax=Micromonospora sp. FIMYZ51 TaxID=3051832 RepID=UPI00312047E3